jgi:hypothetical protein
MTYGDIPDVPPIEDLPLPPPPPRTAEERAIDILPDPTTSSPQKTDQHLAILMLFLFVFLIMFWRPLKNWQRNNQPQTKE